jgi:hypothetical protein
MAMVIYAEASAGTYPGHMVVGQEPPRAVASYFGYRFDPADLPPTHQPPEKWRDYLFKEAVQGRIVDETNYVAHLIKTGARTYYEKRAECDVPIESRLPPRHEWAPHGWYSFNPDDPHPGRQPCYNCVKWGVIIANSLVHDLLPRVHQGRLKLVLAHLRKRVS